MEKEEKNKIIAQCQKIISVLGGGMAGADQAINGSVADTQDIGIHKNVESKSVLQALLKGEVTKEVEELRYRTYLVNREADYHAEADKRNISYKDVKKEHFINGSIRFRQPNKMVKMGLAESLSTPFEMQREKGLINISYENFSKFNISDYATELTVDVNMAEQKMDIDFFIPSATSMSPVNYRQFENAIAKCVGDDRSSDFMFGGIKKVSFTTSDAIGENNDVEYTFIEPMLPKVTKVGNGYSIKYHCKDMQRADLVEKYYSESMAEKYANKEKKELTLGSSKDVFSCCMCGASITREEMEKSVVNNNGNVLCHACEQIYALSKAQEQQDTRFGNLSYGDGGTMK